MRFSLNQPQKWRTRVLLNRLGAWDMLESARVIARFALRKPHEPEFRIFSRLDDRDGLFLDVGANFGQSATSLRIFNRSYRLISFEPNPARQKHLRRLARLLGSRFEYRGFGLGESAQTVHFYVPTVEGCPLTQEGTVFKDELLNDSMVRERVCEATGRSEFEIREVWLEIRTLDELELTPDFIKLDVQGSELTALRGMQNTLKKCGPVLMVENGKDRTAIREFLGGFGYLRVFGYEPASNQLREVGDSGSHLNLFFIPEKRIAEFGAGGWLA